jgi:hypothetical protein
MNEWYLFYVKTVNTKVNTNFKFTLKTRILLEGTSKLLCNLIGPFKILSVIWMNVLV